MSSAAATPHVLFVDDDEAMREVWSLLLVPLGFDIMAVEDAPHALELLRRWLPNVIVTDMMMPGMTGIELFYTLRADEAFRAVPVIFMTSGPFPADRPQEDFWLGKDVSPEQLATKIRSVLA